MKKKGISIGSIAAYIVLVAFVLISLGPVFLVVSNSFKMHVDIVRNPLAIGFNAGFRNYVQAWKDTDMGHSLWNSLKYTGSTCIVVLLFSLFAAYALSKKGLKGSGVIMLYLMISMTVPVQLFLVPLYSFYAQHKLLSNHFAVSLINAACSLPLAISLLRTYFLGIPAQLEEAARIDGATTMQTFRRIVLPLITPGMITVTIITWLNSWNEYLVTSTFLQGKKNFTAMLSLMALNGAQSAKDHGINLAATAILIVPVIIIFIILQRRFVDGLVSGAVKG